jgi:hypothetical protein
MNKKCAICFSGQVRTAERKSVKINIQNHLLRPLQEKGYELFYFAGVDKFYYNYPWSGLMSVSDKNYWGNNIKRYDEKLGPGVVGGSFNVLNQWKKCQTVGRLKKIFEEIHNTTFDVVIRLRPDIILHEPLDVDTLDLNTYNIPNHDNWFGYNDRICISSSQNMDYYMIDFLDKIDYYFTHEKVIFHSETLLKHHLDKKNIPIHRPNFTIRFERESGTDYGNITFN